VPAQPRTPVAPGSGVAQMARLLAAHQGNQLQAAQYATANGFMPEVAAALNVLTPGAGGVLVPVSMAQEVIELFRPKAVVRSLGARTLPLNNGNITMPRLKGGAVVGYIGSDSDAPVTAPQFDALTLTAKKMAAIVPISNDLLNYAGTAPTVDQIITGDLVAAVSAREDKAFIRDDGTSGTPKGLRFWAIPDNVKDATDLTLLVSATDKLQAVENDLTKLILLLESSDANLTSPGWIMSPRVFRFLEALRDGTGDIVYPSLADGVLKGYPVRRTTQIPSNLGAGANESEIYFADFADCFIGEADTFALDYSKEATYKDTDNNFVSAFQRDQTLVRVIVKHDFGPRHVESVAILVKVKWGA